MIKPSTPIILLSVKMKHRLKITYRNWNVSSAIEQQNQEYQETAGTMEKR
jgi:hypothetical protein